MSRLAASAGARVSRSAPVRLTPRHDGALMGLGVPSLPLTSERAQAIVDARGVRDVLVWGSGRGAEVRFEPPLPAEASARVTPNRLEITWDASTLTVSAPLGAGLLQFEGRGDLPTLRLAVPRRAPAGLDGPARLERDEHGWRAVSEWAHTHLLAPDGVVGAAGRLSFGPSGRALLALGADHDEAQRSAGLALADPETIGLALARHDERLRRWLHCADDELQSLALHGLHAALSARKTLADGSFAGFAAGVGYALPARTYYRDAYWTLQALLPLAPELALEQLLLLARGVSPDGEAPSGVIVASPAGTRSWRAQRAADPALARDHPEDGVWWADHSDSPLLFVLLACEVAAWRGEADLLDREVDGRSLGTLVHAVLERAAADASDGLPSKPLHDRDWADNVYRSGAVTYQAGLYHGALTAAARLIAVAEPALAERYRQRAGRLRAAATATLWDDRLGHFVAFREPSARAETALSIDTLTALRYGLADEVQAERTLAAVRERLETRHNVDQPYGDWGVMCLFPPYAPWVRTRGKSRFAFRYHNGADWPYWDGVYAEQRLRRGLFGWRYPLTRSWRYGLERGWATPVEYHSPPFAPGSPSNAWSAMPVAAMLLGGYGLTPDGGARPPPWDGTVTRTLPDGRTQWLRSQGGLLEVEDDG